MVVSSIAGELLDIINKNPYKTTFKHLNDDNAVSSEVIKALEKDHTTGRVYDTSRFQTWRGSIIPDGMYSLFTKYAGETCNDIRDKLSSWAYSNETELKALTDSSFNNQSTNLNWWTLAIINRKRPGDELTLYCLCKLYHRHAIVYNETDYWTTLDCGTDQSEETILEKCDIVLLNLGRNKFCEVIQNDPQQKNTTKTKKQRVAKSISELTKSVRECKQTKGNTKEHYNPARVKLNPVKLGHDTRGSVRKQYNDRPNRSTSSSISYIPDPTSSETDTEPPRK